MIRRARPLLGTFFEISLNAPSEAIAHEAIESGFEEAARLEELLSFFNPQSEITRLNSDAYQAAQQVGDDLLELLKFCNELSGHSSYIFNIVTPQTVDTMTDMILIEGRTVFFRRKIKIDLGGVAKGYIVDKAVQKVLQHSVSNVIVNAGGDLKVAVSDGIPIGIRDPRDPSQCAEAITISSGALATSGPYFSFSKLINPPTGELVNDSKSVSVIAESCMIADALTKVVALSKNDITPLLQRYNATAIVLEVEANGSLSRGYYQ